MEKINEIFDLGLNLNEIKEDAECLCALAGMVVVVFGGFGLMSLAALLS